MRALRARLRREDDGAVLTVEFIGWLPWLLLTVLVCWQLLFVVGTMTAAENAARNGSRAVALGSDPVEVALGTLPTWARDHAQARRHSDGRCTGGGPQSGTRVNVCVAVPVLFPGLTVDAFSIRRSAELPPP